MDEKQNRVLTLPQSNKIVEASRRYGGWFAFRAAVQVLPAIGGPLDTLLAGSGTNWQAQRLERFVKLLAERLEDLPDFDHAQALAASEPFYDFVVMVMEQVARTRSEEKQERFANLVANQVRNSIKWDDADIAARLLSNLTEFHLYVLLSFPVHSIYLDRFHGYVSHLSNSNDDGLDPIVRERLTYTDLITWGLLKQDDVTGVPSEQSDSLLQTKEVSLTPLAKWFINLIENPNNTKK